MGKTCKLVLISLGLTSLLIATELFAGNPTAVVSPSITNKTGTSNETTNPIKKTAEKKNTADDKAQKAAERAEQELAKKIYQERLKINPRDVEARLGLADYY